MGGQIDKKQRDKWTYYETLMREEKKAGTGDKRNPRGYFIEEVQRGRHSNPDLEEVRV